MDYGDFIYDQPFNEYLSNRIDSVQHKAAWCISNHWSHIRIILKKKNMPVNRFGAVTSKAMDETIMLIL